MTARFRPVWLVLDPYTGGRVSLGALVQSDASVEFVAAPESLRPGLSASQRALARLVLRDLAAATSFDELPIGAGPQVVAGDATAVPDWAGAPARWVAERMFGGPVAA